MPDLLHILHGITKDLMKELTWLVIFVMYLASVDRIYSQAWSKGRCLSTMYSEGLVVSWRPKIVGFKGKVHGGRWGSVVHCNSLTLQLKDGIQPFWSLRKFSFGKDIRVAAPAPAPADAQIEEDGGHNKGTKTVLFCDVAILMQLFGGYSAMFDTFVEILAFIQEFVEECPCHPHKIEFLGFAKREGQEAECQNKKRKKCANRGVIAARFAAGEFWKWLHNLLNIAASRVFIMAAALSQDEQKIVMDDFTLGRLIIIALLTLKLSCWSQLPYLLCAFAHHHIETARRFAVAVFALFDSQKERLHRPLILRICRALRRQVEMFANGMSLLHAFLHELYVQVAALRFVMVAARYIEGSHSILHQAIVGRHCITPKYVMWIFVGRCIFDTFSEDPYFLDVLAKLCHEVRDTWSAIQYFKMESQFCIKRFLAIMGRGQMNRKVAKYASEVLFRVNEESLFTV